MSLRVNTVLSFVAAALTIGAIGCKGAPTQDAVCENMAKFMDEGKYTKEECTKDLNKHVVEKCSNVDEVYKCLMEAKDESGVEKCAESTCKKK